MLNNSTYSKAVKTAGALLYSLWMHVCALLVRAYFMAVHESVDPAVHVCVTLLCGWCPPGAAAHSSLMRAAPDVSGYIINTQAHVHAHTRAHADATYHQRLY